MSIDVRRHHKERLKNKRKYYWGFGRMLENPTPRQLNILAETPKICSCYMCRNRRQDEGPTIQERKYAKFMQEIE